MKRILVYMICFTFMCTYAILSIDYKKENQIKNRSPYCLSFASIGAISLESRLDCWAKLKRTSTIGEIKQTILSIANNLNLPVDIKELSYNQAASVIKYEFNYNEDTYQITGKSDSDQTLYILTVTTQKEMDFLQKTERALNESALLDWNYYYLYTGVIDDNIEVKSRDKMIKTVMKNLECKQLEVYKDERLTAAAGYSSVLENVTPYVSHDGKKYNIQAALKSDTNEAKTYIYLGSPLILADY